jgi:hypothetical protein
MPKLDEPQPATRHFNAATNFIVHTRSGGGRIKSIIDPRLADHVRREALKSWTS